MTVVALIFLFHTGWRLIKQNITLHFIGASMSISSSLILDRRLIKLTVEVLRPPVPDLYKTASVAMRRVF